ncbi:hypothetical protein B0H14DRAFT_2911209, partial [Mycena olivaceomarginata]
GCVLFPHCPCLSCSLFLAFLSLGRVCFSHCPCLSCSLFLAFLSLGMRAFPRLHMFVLLTFSPLLVSRDLTERFGMRAFFKHGTAVNHSFFHGQE